MKMKKSFSEQAKSIFKAACSSIEKNISVHGGSITIPYEKAFEITIQSCCNGAYPALLANVSTEGFTCVEEAAKYDNDYDFEDDAEGIVACIYMDYSEVTQIDVCRVADYLSRRSNYANRYGQLLSKAEELIAQIPEGLLLELKGCESNYLDDNADFVYSDFIAAGRDYALTCQGERISWSRFLCDDLLLVADCLALAYGSTTIVNLIRQ